MLEDKAYYAEMLPVIEQLADGALKNGMDTDNQAMNVKVERSMPKKYGGFRLRL